jgi:hypothetical protein
MTCFEPVKVVGLADKIKELPKGLDTLMGDEINLLVAKPAPGYCQGFLTKTPLYYFDEGMTARDENC